MPSAYSKPKIGRLTWIGGGIVGIGVILSAILLPKTYSNGVLGTLLVLFAIFVACDLAPMPRLDPGEKTVGLTIRHQLQRTTVLFVRVTVPVMALWCAVVTLYFPNLTRPEGTAAAVAGCLVLFAPALMFIKGRLRCPRCGTDFKKERIALLGKGSGDTRSVYELWDKCPNCGVNFDEPYRK